MMSTVDRIAGTQALAFIKAEFARAQARKAQAITLSIQVIEDLLKLYNNNDTPPPTTSPPVQTLPVPLKVLPSLFPAD